MIFTALFGPTMQRMSYSLYYHHGTMYDLTSIDFMFNTSNPSAFLITKLNVCH